MMHYLVEIHTDIYVFSSRLLRNTDISRLDLYEISVYLDEILSRTHKNVKVLWVLCVGLGIFSGRGLDKLRVLWYARLAHKTYKHLEALTQDPDTFMSIQHYSQHNT